VGARRNRHRRKHFNRQYQSRTDQRNNQGSFIDSAASHAAAESNPVELGGSQSATALSAPKAAFSPAQSARTSWKVLVILFSISVPMGLVALGRMKESPLFDFGAWHGSDGTAVSTSSSLQDTTLHNGPNQRFALHEVHGVSGQPLPLGISLDGVVDDAVVIVRGLIPGMTLSTGSALGANAWRLPASEFANAWIGPPKDFSGVLDVTAELHLPDQSVADRRRLRLEWSPPSELPSEDPTSSLEPAALALRAHQVAPRLIDGSAHSPTRTLVADAAPSAPLEAAVNPVFASAHPTVSVQSPSVSPASAEGARAAIIATSHPSMPTQGSAASPNNSAMPRSVQLDAEQIATLVERGKALIAAGDLAAARVVLRRAAESKDAVAALALGSTYDPVILRELKAVGFAPDLEIARSWYEKARELGSEEAQRRIQILARLGS
jgi:hypothetical protein